MPSHADFIATLRDGLPGWVADVVAAATATTAEAAGGSGASHERLLATEALAFLRRGGMLAGEAWMQALRRHLECTAPASLERSGATGAGGTSSLMLIGEDRVDEDIEIAGIGQRVEAAAGRELRQLALLHGKLAAREGAQHETVPLSPLACAHALREALTTLALTAEVRLVLLRHLGAALAVQLPALYAQQVSLLAGWGLQASAERPLPARAAIHPELAASLARLVAWARRQHAAAAGGEALQALQGDTAARLMRQLFNQIEQQPALSQSAQQLLQRLRGAGSRVSEQMPEVWDHFEHPWWQLLDRIVAMGTVHADEPGAEPDPVTATLAAAVDQLQRSRTIEAARLAAAVAAIDRATERWLDNRGHQLGPEVEAMQRQAERRETEQAVRQQITAQLRAAPVPDVLRRFLTGPWVLAMTETAMQLGIESTELAAQAQVLDDLQAAGRERVGREERRLLIARVRAGLVRAGLQTPRVDAEMLALAELLRKPPPPPPLPVGLQDEPDDDDEAPAALRPDLPTVPVDMFDGGAGTTGPGISAATRDREAWLDGLQAGTRCRMFLMDRWMTTQLTWVSPNRRLYVFHSRHGGRVHSMTRRVLGKLRNAGLAATLERGRLLAEAMDRLTDFGEEAA